MNDPVFGSSDRSLRKKKDCRMTHQRYDEMIRLHELHMLNISSNGGEERFTCSTAGPFGVTVSGNMT